MQSSSTMGPHTMMDRIIGVVTLKAPIYREIADDQSATTTAAIIVVVMALLSSILGAAVIGAFGAALPGVATGGSTVGYIIRTFITAIISWLVGAWFIAFVSKTFFGGKTDMWEMARVFGFTQVFTIISIIPCLGIVGVILSLIGAVIGIREASEFDTTKAILTAVVAFIGLIIVSFVLAAILGLVGLA